MVISDKKELVKLCSFIVMGDGGVYQNGSNCYFVMNMLKENENEDYVMLCKSIIENVTSCRVNEVEMGGKTYLNLESRNHPYFNTLRDRIYVDKYKSIDVHALKLLDYEALSFLYMSDGCCCLKNGYKCVTLNMKRLSYGDLFMLKKALKEKLDLEWNINKNGKYFYLTLRVKDHDKFFKGIKQFITPSFMYKILDEMPSDNKEVVK